MLKKQALLYSLAAGLFILLSVAKICFVTSDDLRHYKALVEEYKQIAAQSLTQSTTQTRSGVRKDIFFTQDDASRLQYRIESESSVLTLAPINNKMDIVENLHNIRCWMQEKLFDMQTAPSQQIRYLKANEGTYRFSQQQFLANSVALSLFRLPGHTLSTPTSTEKAFLKGLADEVSFSVSGKTPQFVAHHFTASLRQEDDKK